MAVEHQIVEIVKELKRTLKIPIAVKLSPFFAAFGNIAHQLDLAGADGLVMFNRFYQPDIDIKTMRPSPQVELSTSAELLLRLRWLAILYGRVRPSLAVTGGVADPNDGIKALLAGADAVQMVSALLRHGPGYMSAMRLGLEHWMEWNKMTSLDEVRGRVSLKQTKDPAAFERANYIRALAELESLATMTPAEIVTVVSETAQTLSQIGIRTKLREIDHEDSRRALACSRLFLPRVFEPGHRATATDRRADDCRGRTPD